MLDGADVGPGRQHQLAMDTDVLGESCGHVLLGTALVGGQAVAQAYRQLGPGGEHQRRRLVAGARPRGPGRAGPPPPDLGVSMKAVRRILHVAWNDLRIMVGDKVFFFWSLVFPMLFIVLFGLVFFFVATGAAVIVLRRKAMRNWRKKPRTRWRP